MSGSPDYTGKLIAYGIYQGSKYPLLLDSSGRVVYTRIDYVEYTPVITWQSFEAVITTLWGRYKIVNDVVSVSVFAESNPGLGGGNIVSISLPFTADPVYTAGASGWYEPVYLAPPTRYDAQPYIDMTTSPPVIKFNRVIDIGAVSGSAVRIDAVFKKL